MLDSNLSPEQRMKIAEMEYEYKVKLNNCEAKCCNTRIDGNERVLRQMEINNYNQACCCKSVAEANLCCCKK